MKNQYRISGEQQSARKIVIINQASNYLTVAICNEFHKKFENTALITGSIHEQGEKIDANINVVYITKWKEDHGFRKALIYLKATMQIWYLLLTKFRKHEVFFISLPPMGYLLNLLVGNRFSMLLWDVYPDVFKITGMKEKHMLYKLWSYFNKRSFKKAYKIFTIGNNIRDSLNYYCNDNKVHLTPIWSIFQENDKVNKSDNPFIKDHNMQAKFVIQYSGNIGLTHNVEVLLDIAKRMQSHSDILFQIIGRGPRKRELQQRVISEKINNCNFLPFQTDEMFPFSLSAADLGVVILDNLASKGSVPSKSYNLMSYGIPSLYIASEDSELNNYTKKYKHAACFDPTQFNKIIEYILKLKEDEKFYNKLAKNSLIASKDFKRSNATRLVEDYIEIEWS